MYYRGTDKQIETIIDSYDSYYIKLLEIINNDKEITQIIIQTDTAQFKDYINNKNININIIYIIENSLSYTSNGIHDEKKYNSKLLRYTNIICNIFNIITM